VAGAILYSILRGVQVFVAEGYCRVCEKVTVYDGVNDRVFNFGKGLLFTHGLLNEFTNTFTSADFTIHGFWQVNLRNYAPTSAIAFPSKTLIAAVLYAFLRLQAWTCKVWYLLSFCDQCVRNDLFCLFMRVCV